MHLVLVVYVQKPIKLGHDPRTKVPHAVQLHKVAQLFPLFQQFLGAHLRDRLARDFPRQVETNDRANLVLLAAGDFLQDEPEKAHLGFGVVRLEPIERTVRQVTEHVEIRLDRFVVDKGDFLAVAGNFGIDRGDHVRYVVLRWNGFVGVV